jgi:2-(1,2-epoxy-1,2-dihydrophenyl)acetyl-CoA isomerase
MTTVLIQRSGGLVTVTLNKPERRNALDIPMWEAMTKLFEEIGKSKRDRVLVLTGAGSSFCAGGDLSGGDAAGGGGDKALDVMRATVNAFVLGLFHLPIPTIAAVEGSAAGAGANLAFACDLVIAGESARFSEIFVRRALPVDSGGSWLLPRLIGLQKSKELAFFGDWVSAHDAAELGLVNRVVPEGESLATATEWAGRLVEKAPTALRHSKQNLNAAFEVDLADSLDQEANSIFECTQAPEFAAAVAELFAKQKR